MRGGFVLAAVRDALRPVEVATGHVRSPAEATADLHAAVTLLREVGGRAAEAATLLEQRAPGLTAYLTDLARALAGPRTVLPADSITFLAWAWRHLKVLTVLGEYTRECYAIRLGRRLESGADAFPGTPIELSAVSDRCSRTSSSHGPTDNTLSPI